MKQFFACALLCAAAAFGQSVPAAAPAGEVVGPGNFIHVVSNLDNSLAFYHDVIGMELQRAGGARGNAAPAPVPDAPRPYITTPEILRLYNSVGAQFRVSAAMVQESPMRAELIEFKDVERKPVRPRFVDPGASNFILTVRDIGAIMERVKKSGTPVVTAGGEPITIDGERGKARAVVVKDPDGFFVELVQPETLPENAAQSSNNILNIGFGFTVENTDRMVHVFKDALGFTPQTGAFTPDKARLNLVGAPAGAQFRRTTALIPGSSLQVEFLEFKGVDGKAVHSGTHDPGSAVLRLRIKDMDSMVKSLAATGVTVASADGVPVLLGNANGGGQRFAITSAPDNLFVQVVQQVQRAQ
jgi:catechol 2,3-dioxygenase-like lactoylglutathione lyase family enzyme